MHFAETFSALDGSFLGLGQIPSAVPARQAGTTGSEQTKWFVLQVRMITHFAETLSALDSSFLCPKKTPSIVPARQAGTTRRELLVFRRDWLYRLANQITQGLDDESGVQPNSVFWEAILLGKSVVRGLFSGTRTHQALNAADAGATKLSK